MTLLESSFITSLLKLEKKKSIKDAVVLYLVFVVVAILIESAIGSIIGLSIGKTIEEQRRIGIDAGIWMSVIIVVTSAFAILYKKKLEDNGTMLVVALFSGILAFIGGPLLGFIPVAYLATVSKRQK